LGWLTTIGNFFWPFWFAVLWLTKSQFAGNRSISPASKFSIFPLPWWKNLSFPTIFPTFLGQLPIPTPLAAPPTNSLGAKDWCNISEAQSAAHSGSEADSSDT
jgi:hypothetical protein